MENLIRKSWKKGLKNPERRINPELIRYWLSKFSNLRIFDILGILYPVQVNKLTYIALITLFGFAAQAQSLEIIYDKNFEHGIIGQEIKTQLKIKNISSQIVYFKVYELKKQIGSGQKSFLCFSSDCENEVIANNKRRIDDVEVQQLAPGLIAENIYAVLETGLLKGISSITYRIAVENSPEENIDLELQYEVSEPPKGGLLYSSLNVDLSDVYPNPVTETAMFDYNIKDDSKEAKIIIHNVLGSVAGEYKLNPYEQQLKISVENFNPGVYFYSLYIDNVGVATKKLVVRK